MSSSFASLVRTLSLSGYSRISGAILVDSIRMRTGSSVAFPHLVRAGAAPHEAGDVPFDELELPLWCSQCRTAAKDDQPLLVRVVEVVRPELLAGIDLVHASGEEFGADPLADPGLLNPE